MRVFAKHLLLASASGALVLAGCAAPEARNEPVRRHSVFGQGQHTEKPKYIDASGVETSDDIIGVHAFWPAMPWMFTSRRVHGFSVPVYFYSGEKEKGAFVPGSIYCWLYKVPGAYSDTDRELLHTWTLDERAAMGFRVRKRVVGGYFYGLQLQWPADLKLDGETIEVQFGYERGDGRVIRSVAYRQKVLVPPSSSSIAGRSR